MYDFIMLIYKTIPVPIKLQVNSWIRNSICKSIVIISNLNSANPCVSLLPSSTWEIFILRLQIESVEEYLDCVYKLLTCFFCALWWMPNYNNLIKQIYQIRCHSYLVSMIDGTSSAKKIFALGGEFNGFPHIVEINAIMF